MFEVYEAPEDVALFYDFDYYDILRDEGQAPPLHNLRRHRIWFKFLHLDLPSDNPMLISISLHNVQQRERLSENFYVVSHPETLDYVF